jgi:hypothetical protein
VPTIAVVAGMTIRMYYADHDPPHFHVESADFRAKFAIDEAAPVEVVGRMRPSESVTIRLWAQRHHDALMQNWRCAQRLERLVRIDR